MIPSTALAAYRKSYPLDLGLYNDDQQEVLYITDDPSGHNLHLNISNASGQPVMLCATANTTVGSSNYHFALRFRPGTLSATFQSCISYAVSTLQGGKPDALSSTLQTFATETTTALQALQQQGWSLGYEQEPSGTVALYFLSAQPQTLAPGATVRVIFPHASAASAAGARSTRVEMRYQHVSLDNNVTRISGNRQMHLTIVNQRGQKHIPLHVSFVGSNTILNDGKAQNTLTLRITNPQKGNAIALSPAGSTAPSRFILSFDVQADNATTDWALGTVDQVRHIDVNTTDPGHWSLTSPSGQEEVPEWIVTPMAGKDALAANEAVTVTLREIISSLPSGQTNLYIGYENIPGYWDGQFVVAIEKSPLLYQGNNVGIGTATPFASLEVKGADCQLCITNTTERSWGLAHSADDMLYFQAREHGNLQANLMSLDRRGLLTLNGLNVNQKAAITPDGSVGIGTTTPHGALEIGPTVINANAWVYFQSNANGVANPSTEVRQGLMLSWNPSGGQGEMQLLYATALGSMPRLDFGRWDGSTKRIDMTLDGGKVGIGVTDPKNQLVIASQASFGGNTSNTGAEPIEVQGPGAGISLNDRTGGTTGRWVLYSDRIGGAGTETLRFWSSNDKVAITQDGNVGIGTTSPSNQLVVAAQASFGGNTHNRGTEPIEVQGKAAGISFYDRALGATERWVIYAEGLALHFWSSEGQVAILPGGVLTAKAKSFRINHPTKSESYLIHACLEGPELGVYYHGQARLEDGRATIRLPDYFEALTRQKDRTVQLTPEGREPFLLSYEAIVDGTFKVYGTRPNGAFSWEVKAVRADVEPLEPEVSK